MSAITLEQARTNLANLMNAESVGNFRAVSIGGRSVSYASAQEMQSAITYWTRLVSELERKAAGRPRHGYSVGGFSGRVR